MPLSQVPLDAFRKTAVGIKRPEDVMCLRDGRVFASHHDGAVAEIHRDGTFRVLGTSTVHQTASR